MGQGRISFSYGAENFSVAGFPGRFPVSVSADMLAGMMSGLNDRWMMDAPGARFERERRMNATQRERLEAFVELLFDEETDACERHVDEVFALHNDPQRIAETLFEPAARIIGENWCTDECDFLKVTLSVSRMQRMFRRLAATVPPQALCDLSRCALLAPAPGEEHTFGLSIVEDALRRAGWEVDCCGVDEALEMHHLAAANHYQIVGLSLSGERLRPDLNSTIARLRSKSRNKSVVLMAGGRLVANEPQLALDVGFDLVASDAASAVMLAESVLAPEMMNCDRTAAE